MTPLDYSCSYCDIPSNFACGALPGELCNWPDGNGGSRKDTQCHAERMQAAAAMNSGSGAVPGETDFDRAVDAVLSDQPTRTEVP